jgi:glycosyltransferase involved in cell wall biosynthesis
MNSPPKLLLLIPHLGGGGAEQVTAMLAQGLSREKYELHLGLIAQADLSAQPSLPGVRIHLLGASRVRSSPFRLLRLVRRLKPDLVLSGMAHLNFMVLLLRSLFPHGTRVLVRQNGTASAALSCGDLPAYTRLLYRVLYPHADRVICQTQAMAADLAAILRGRDARLTVLPNPLDVDGIRASIRERQNQQNQWSGSGPHLLAIGRLSREKGFDLLFGALAAVRTQFPNADLLLAGAGPQEPALKAECHRLGLQAAVRFAGHVDRPADFFPGSSLFVLSSRHEGLPNALLEAAAGGLPIVALPASAGVVDLLQGQPGTWLATEISAPALSSALLAALQVLTPGQRFAHSFIEPFRFQRAIHAWEDLIDAALRESRPS